METKKAVVFCNQEKPAARREMPRLKKWFGKKGISIVPPHQIKKADLAVALGGDGTLLMAARQLAPWGVPVLGINVGHLGFLAGTDPKRMYKTLQQLIDGRLPVSHRMMLEVTPPRRKKQLALNDCVIRVGGTARAVPLSAWVDGQYLATYFGDGLILSTPTGSTAYSLAAWGPIAQPDMDLILLTPICSHSLTQRPVILPPHRTLEIRVEEHDKRDAVILSLDGQSLFPLRVGDRVKVQKAKERLQLFYEREQPYFSLLRQKLKWGER